MHLQISPVNLAPVFFLRPGGACGPSAPPGYAYAQITESHKSSHLVSSKITKFNVQHQPYHDTFNSATRYYLTQTIMHELYTIDNQLFQGQDHVCDFVMKNNQRPGSNAKDCIIIANHSTLSNYISHEVSMFVCVDTCVSSDFIKMRTKSSSQYVTNCAFFDKGAIFPQSLSRYDYASRFGYWVGLSK